MNLESLKTQRKGLKTAFTLILKKIEDELSKDTSDLQALLVSKIQFYDKFQRLDACQNQISEILSQDQENKKLFSDDFEAAEVYRDNYLEACARIDKLIHDAPLPSKNKRRKFKLPKIELKKFNGQS